MTASRVREVLGRAMQPSLALLTAFLLGAALIVLSDLEHLGQLGTDPVGAIGGALGGVVKAYTTMFTGAIGDPGRIVAAIQSGNTEDIERALRPVSETLISATPFIFTSLGVAVAFHAGLFNLGVAGQFLIAGLGASLTAAIVAGYLPPPLALVVAIAGGTLSGAAYALIPGYLKARTGAHEVITTLMLNGVAGNLAFLIVGMLSFVQPTGPIPSVPRISDLPTIRVDYGFVVALVIAAVMSWLLYRTTVGFELRVIGFSRTAAPAAGIHPGRTMILAMALSGGLIGMGSAFFLLGPAEGLGGPPSYDFGWVSIALALLAGRRPGGVVLVALLYGALDTGAKSMVIATGIPLTLLSVIIAFAITFVAAPQLTRSIWRIRTPPPTASNPAVSM